MDSRGVLAIVQARMSSTRLPGKSLADICGEPALALLLTRLARAKHVGEIVVATSTDAADDQIAELAAMLSFRAARGPREDVLGRFLLVIGDRSGPVVRITGDCPLIDPGVVDVVVERFWTEPACTYASNVQTRTFPDGLDVEVVDSGALRNVSKDSLSASEREHVTLAIRDQPARFSSASVTNREDLGRLRWTVDGAEDLAFVRAVTQRLGDRRYDADMDEILAAVRSPPSLADFGGAPRG